MFSLMRALTARGGTAAAFAMHDSRNLPSPWERYFVSALDTRHAGWGVGALRQAARAFWSFEAARKMRAMLAAFHPDVVHVHNIYTHLSPSVLAECRRVGVPIVMTVHDYALVSANYTLWDGDRPLAAGKNTFARIARSRFIKGSVAATATLEMITRLQRMLGMYDRVVDRYITLSQFMKGVMVAVGYDAAKITVVPPGVALADTGTYTQGDEVLFVGRLEKYKGVDTFIDALRMCRDVQGRIVGDGPARGAFALRAQGMRNVHFDGFLSGAPLRNAYASARVLVVPSLWYEPFGLVVLEAMAAGIPVIVSDRGGLPEIVGDEEGGVVVPAGDAKALAAAIRRFVDDPVWACEMGKRAKKRAMAFGGPEQHLDRIAAIYEACG